MWTRVRFQLVRISEVLLYFNRCKYVNCHVILLKHFLKTKGTEQKHRNTATCSQTRSVYVLPLMSKPIFIPIQNQVQNYSSLCYNFYVFRQLMNRQMVLDWMVVSTARIQSPLDFLMNQILLCYCLSKICELCHIFKVSISYFYIMILPYILGQS
jgi:hypothetical protein